MERLRHGRGKGRYPGLMGCGPSARHPPELLGDRRVYPGMGRDPAHSGFPASAAISTPNGNAREASITGANRSRTNPAVPNSRCASTGAVGTGEPGTDASGNADRKMGL